MQTLSFRKQTAVVRLYLSGFPYDEIAAQTAVAKGSVANVVAELKAGRFPEVGSVPEQLEVLRELASDLRRTKLTPGQASAGLAVLSYLQGLGLEPAQVESWARLCHQLSDSGVGAPAIVKAALTLEQVRERTGLDVEALEEKARNLEETAARLEPAVAELQEHQTQLRKLGKHWEGLSREVDSLEKRREPLRQAVAQNEERDRELTSRVHDLEQRAHAADERLAVARKDLEALAGLGLSRDGLSGFMERLKGVAQRHGIKPGALRERLVQELETLQAGLSLEGLIKKKRHELTEVEQVAGKAQEERMAMEAAVKDLRQQAAALRGVIAAEQKAIRKEVQAVAATVRSAAGELKQELADSLGQAVAEVQRLRDQSLELGREMGRFEAVVQANEWLEGLLSLTRGDGDIQAHQVRTVGLAVLRGTLAWLERHPEEVPPFTIKTRAANLVSELEQWRL